MTGDKKLPKAASEGAVADFLRKVALTPPAPAGEGRGRLIFALDATASREPTWDRASHIQAQMFSETAALGGLEIQLVYYRGFGECKAGPWVHTPDALLRYMTGVFCLAGQTQIAKVLKHALHESEKKAVAALVFVGDCVEEDIDQLGHLAGQLGLRGVPCFMFHEGNEPTARSAFQQIARLTGGAYCPFDANSAQQLRDLLSAVAVFAAGGRRALADYSKGKAGVIQRLTHQVK